MNFGFLVIFLQSDHDFPAYFTGNSPLPSLQGITFNSILHLMLSRPINKPTAMPNVILPLSSVAVSLLFEDQILFTFTE